MVKVSVFATDSLKTSKNSVIVNFSFGIPILNKLSIYPPQEYSHAYSVNSKQRNCYGFSLTTSYKKFNYTIGLSLIQSEFKGNDFKAYSYFLYQDIKYNVYYATIGFGRNLQINKKQIITPSIYIYIPTVYDFKINNIYSKDNSIDTSLIAATKNAFNFDTNFGHFPRLKFGVSYNYFITQRFALCADISFLYAKSVGGKTPDTDRPETVFNHTNNYSYLAYKIKYQLILLPSIGITYKLN